MPIGPLMLDLEGLSLTQDERRLLLHPMVGAVIFFARNYESRQQLCCLVGEIRSLRPELLLCVDQEGGRVQRFREGFTRIPPMQKLGDKLAAGEEDAAQLLRDSGWLMAAEVLSCGVDFSFAPVLDIDRNRCEVIADRSFCDEPALVTQAAGYFISGMHEAGMAATGKHFPGHGGVAGDSHLETPYDTRSLEEIRQRDMQPFVDLKDDLDAVMPAHIVFPNIDGNAVGFSRFWLQQVLRQELGFDGVIFSDDLSMKGADVAGGYRDKALAALEAGCDMVLVCNDRAGALEVLRVLEEEGEVRLSAQSASRLARMAMKQSPDIEELKQLARWQRVVSQLENL